MVEKYECEYIAKVAFKNFKELYPENQGLRDSLCRENNGLYCLYTASPFVKCYILKGVFIKFFWRPKPRRKFKYLTQFNIQYKTTPLETDKPYWEYGHGQKADPWKEVILECVEN